MTLGDLRQDGQISCIDQRISNDRSCKDALAFFCDGPDSIDLMSDYSHCGEGQHDKQNMGMLAMPGAGFVVIETKFILDGLEAVSMAQRCLLLPPVSSSICF